jgi:hypothetical protein
MKELFREKTPDGMENRFLDKLENEGKSSTGWWKYLLSIGAPATIAATLIVVILMKSDTRTADFSGYWSLVEESVEYQNPVDDDEFEYITDSDLI